MDTSLQPHQGGIVLALGVLSLIPPFMFLPLGLAAWIMGRKDIRAMNERRMNGSGRTATQIGQVCGALGASIWLTLATFWVLGILHII